MMAAIKIDNILLDPENPRHNPIEYQREILAFFSQDKETLELAKDIATFGVNPGIRPICIPHESHKDKFIAIDGNRRLAAIKLLLDPDFCQDPNVQKKYSEYSVSERIPGELECATVASREEGRHWLELLHGGKQEGAGQVQWSPIQKQRFYGDKGRYPYAMNILNYLSNSFGMNIEGVPLSTLDRIIQDTYVRSVLGFEFEEGKTETTKEQDGIGVVLKRIAEDLISKKIKEPDVTDKDLRKKYLDRVLSEEKVELKDAPKKFELHSETPKPQPKAKPKLAPSSLNRSYMVPSDFRASVKHHRANKLYRELRGINVNRFENACSGLFRTLVAISCLVYKEDVMCLSVSRESKPSTVLREVLEYMQRNSLLTDLDAKPVRSHIDNKDSPYSLDTLNSSLHNPNQTPTSDGLKKMWNDLTPFLSVLLDSI